jgi:hypothetical protein
MKKMLAVVAAASLVAVAAPAFAANPFSDVPMNHWAYDAVEQMAAKGILEGYPNGTFKGNRAMTRYEIAQMVAHMMANGVGGADADKLKALIVEFAPELEALGVKVDGFDGRLSKLEKGVGGIKISGQARFDYVNRKNEKWPGDGYGNDYKEHGFNHNRHRINFSKELANGVSVNMRWQNGSFDRYWINANDFLGMQGLTFKAGSFLIDWMDDDSLYFAASNSSVGVAGAVGADDAQLMAETYRGVLLKKTFAAGEVSAFAASDIGIGGYNFKPEKFSNGEYYGARLKFNLGEKFWLSGNMYIQKPGSATIDSPDAKFYWVGAGVNFRGVQLKGAYMWMKDAYVGATKLDNGNMWKLILDVPQDTLKFTSLWVEYAKRDKEFKGKFGQGFNWFNPLKDWNGDYRSMNYADSKILLIGARQQWTKKFSTFERYTQVKYDDGYGKDKEWVVGLGYAYTPNLLFELSYNNVEYAENGYTLPGEDKIVRFRTVVNF